MATKRLLGMNVTKGSRWVVIVPAGNDKALCEEFSRRIFEELGAWSRVVKIPTKVQQAYNRAPQINGYK